jgi:poly-gamma-glutamate capsule biosynthesis protein CapA/YwtB (metallophosphatase superfamily)
MNTVVQVLVLCLFRVFLNTQDRAAQTATFIFAGDLSFAHAFERSYQNHPFYAFAHWDQAGRYDGMMVNLENSVTRSSDSVDKEFVFKMKPEFLSQLRSAKVSLVNCANNHTADFGFNGILETIQQLDSAGIRHVGVGKDFADARKPVVLVVHGIRIGFLGYGGVKEFIAGKGSPGTNSRNEQFILNDIRRLRSSVDAVVVSLHWGEELALEPDQDQIALAHKIIDGGADLIIGHHPHVLQGIERYRDKIIAYSLGNFIFGGNAGCANSETAVLKVTVSQETLEVKPLPIRVRNWQPEPADSVAAERTLQRMEERSKLFHESFFSQ